MWRVLTGPNGCGKANLYNSLLLIARAAQGQFAAGGERIRYTRKKPARRVMLAFESDEYGYEIQMG